MWLVEWEKQALIHDSWETEPRTIEMKNIALVLQLPQMQQRLTTIKQEQERQQQLRQTEFPRKDMEQNQQFNRGFR
ncbi:hypothetical protein BZZ01_10725 [Nostocales cyanobacterium HT-58-2]|nr:hypothetical protein BZZ01_10725 [Nostocales cyanobacterium HT-58-2]